MLEVGGIGMGLNFRRALMDVECRRKLNKIDEDDTVIKKRGE